MKHLISALHARLVLAPPQIVCRTFPHDGRSDTAVDQISQCMCMLYYCTPSLVFAQGNYFFPVLVGDGTT